MTALTLDQQTAEPRPGNMNKFLIIWFGQVISMLGSGLTAFALGVWIFQKTGQATPFALTILFSNLPRILLLPVAGSLADRWNRRLVRVPMTIFECAIARALFETIDRERAV